MLLNCLLMLGAGIALGVGLTNIAWLGFTSRKR